MVRNKMRKGVVAAAAASVLFEQSAHDAFAKMSVRTPAMPATREVAEQPVERAAQQESGRESRAQPIMQGAPGEGQATALPPGWEEVSDPEHGTFFYNTVAGVSVWERPTAPAGPLAG